MAGMLRLATRSRSLVLVALLSACSGGDQMKHVAAVEAQVAEFHRRLDTGDASSLYELAADEFRSAAPKERTVGYFGVIHAKLGAIKESKRTTWHVHYRSDGTKVEINYQTTFANGSGIEHFVFKIGEPVPRLSYYKIDSEDLAKLLGRSTY